ncbi:hypothetical protein BH18ACI4_BH18ACI4_01210 [soil metagenome]
MAIGWGKSFEDQVEEGNQRISANEREVRLPAEARARLQRVESLKLSRSRMLDQLERARHHAHREVLMKGLRAIEKEIEEVTGE